jgi:tape measure domain-containing protein
MATDLGSAYFSLIPSMAGFNQAVSRQLSGSNAIGTTAGRALGGNFTSGFSSIIGGGAIAGVVGGVAAAATNALGQAIGAGFSAAKGAVFDFNSTLQNSTIGFTSMLGSAQKASTFVGDLKNFAAKTPFDFESLVKYAQNLMGMGVAGKQVIPVLTSLGDAVANAGGDSNQLNGAVLAYSQLAAKQKVDLGNILQLQNAGVPALKYLAAAYHTTQGSLIDMISSGKVLSAQALPALNKAIEKGAGSAPALGGAMDKLSTTFSGALANIQDMATQTIATAFKPLFDSASTGLQQVAAALGSPAFATFATQFSAGLSTALTNLKGFFTVAGPGFGAFIAQVGPLSAVIQKFAGSLGTQFAGIAAKVTPVLQQIGAELPAIFAKVFPVVQSVIGAILGAVNTLLPPILNLAQVAFPLIASAVATVFPVIVRVFNSIVAAVTPLIQLLSVVLPPVFTGLLAIVGPVFNTIGNIIVGVMQVVQGIITTVLGVVTGNWDQAWQGLVSIVSGVWNVILAVIRAPLAVITNVIQSNLFGIRDTWNNVWNGIASFIGGIWSRVVSTVTGGVGRVVGAVQTINGRIMAAIGNVGNLLISSGRALIQGFIDGITGMIGGVGKAVGGFMDFVKGFFPHSPAKRGPFSGAGWRQVASSGARSRHSSLADSMTGSRDFASTVGGIVPDTISSSVAGTITNTSRGNSSHRRHVMES